MRRIAMTYAICLACSAVAENAWHRLDDTTIRDTLTDAVYVYENGATQRFYASGRTLYKAGNDSWGYWEARGGQYCSQWPPANGWACYDVETQGSALRFIGDSGDITVGHPQ